MTIRYITNVKYVDTTSNKLAYDLEEFLHKQGIYTEKSKIFNGFEVNEDDIELLLDMKLDNKEFETTLFNAYLNPDREGNYIIFIY